MAGKGFYVSWVDKRTDPWPLWERIQEGQSELNLEGRRVTLLPTDHPSWPGAPLLDAEGVAQVSDGKMGRYSLPGVPLVVDGRPCRVFTGPTLSALFHPRSQFHNLERLDGVYLLYQPDSQGSPHGLLEKALHQICKKREIANYAKRIKLVPIAGITDPTDHALIIGGIERWLKREDPFEFGRKRAGGHLTRVAINLSPGTPAMHACWLMLRWNGALGGPQAVVEFVQGDGGTSRASPDDTGPGPLKIVPIDALSLLVGHQGAAPEAPGDEALAVRLEGLEGPPFDELRQKIGLAAGLGLPILLQGERGTGKTFLARHYHQCRQAYRREHGRPDGEETGPARRDAKERPGKAKEQLPRKTAGDNFVAVTLSEFGDLDNLRDSLFGWAKASWTGAEQAFDGLLGEAHGGTLFLDEIHHLEKSLQAALLGPLNNRRYRPKMATYEITSHFDLVVATNDPQWRQKMADDFRDRVERIVLEVPSFRSFQRHGAHHIWRFWEFTIRRRCQECGIEYAEEGAWDECREQLRGVFRRHPLPGNWRDLQRLADNLLLHLVAARDGRPAPLRWNKEQLDHAIDATFSDL